MEDIANKGGRPVAKDELTVAKINAAIKILEWSREAIEPGIGGTPNQLHVALADAFRVVYGIVSDAVVTTNGSKSPEEIPEGAIA
jgi:hypothetical protein